jgi:hypothetical protein
MGATGMRVVRRAFVGWLLRGTGALVAALTGGCQTSDVVVYGPPGGATGDAQDVLPSGAAALPDAATGSVGDLAGVSALARGYVLDGATGEVVGDATVMLVVGDTGVGSVATNAAGLFALTYAGTAASVTVRATAGGAQSAAFALELDRVTDLCLVLQSALASARQVDFSIIPDPVLAEIGDFSVRISAPELVAADGVPSFAFAATGQGVGLIDPSGFFVPYAVTNGRLDVAYGSGAQATDVHVRASGAFGKARGQVLDAQSDPVADALVTATLQSADTLDLTVTEWSTTTDGFGQYDFSPSGPSGTWLPPGTYTFTATQGDKTASATAAVPAAHRYVDVPDLVVV